MATMATVLQYINTSNKHVAHLKFTQWYKSNIVQLKKILFIMVYSGEFLEGKFWIQENEHFENLENI